MIADPRRERSRLALTILSAVGAALADVGVSVLPGAEPRPLD
jgi:hypothetical protein